MKLKEGMIASYCTGIVVGLLLALCVIITDGLAFFVGWPILMATGMPLLGLGLYLVSKLTNHLGGQNEG